jgi:cytochrome c biogenesis protein ResB
MKREILVLLFIALGFCILFIRKCNRDIRALDEELEYLRERNRLRRIQTDARNIIREQHIEEYARRFREKES